MFIFAIYFMYVDYWTLGNSPKCVYDVAVMTLCCSSEEGVWDDHIVLDLAPHEYQCRMELERRHNQHELTDFEFIPF